LSWINTLVDPYYVDWIHLLLRMLHLIAGIAWIGSSFYFIALDLKLLPPGDPHDQAQGVGGEVWEIHGGGFYHVKKFRVAPATLPEPLHWFYWEAYTTWLSGAGLLILLYFLDPEIYLIDRRVLNLSGPAAVSLAVFGMALGLGVYEALCRLLEGRDRLLALCVAMFIVILTFAFSLAFSGRAVYILVGATIATWMAANVFLVIIPGHRELVKAIVAGTSPDPIHGIRGKTRSVHNNYLTLPVLFAMISNHFPGTFGHPQGWLVLLAIMAIGAWIRHFFNLRNQGRPNWWIVVTAAIASAILVFLLAPERAPAAPPPSAGLPVASKTGAAPAVTLAQANEVIQRRCITCHAATPSNSSFVVPPKGVAFDTPEQVRAQAALIYQQAVVSQAMPLGNLTGMTPDERRLLGAWFRQGGR
jgi:uncharacterized membrane protein